MRATTNSLRGALLLVSLGFLGACDAPQPEVAPAADEHSPGDRSGRAKRLEEQLREIERLERARAALQVEVDQAQRQLEALERNHSAGAPAPLAPPAPTVPTMRPASAPSIHGIVTAVNNQVDVFVISAGSKDGVAVGMECHVTRNGEPVTTLVIDKVFPNYSSGATKPGVEKRDVESGDEANFVPLGFSPPK